MADQSLFKADRRCVQRGFSLARVGVHLPSEMSALAGVPEHRRDWTIGQRCGTLATLREA